MSWNEPVTPDLHHLAAAYALDALDELERREFEAHYPTCSICADEVAEFRKAATALAESVARTPPAELKSRVMAGIAETRQLPPVAANLADRRRPMGQWILATAAAVLLLAGALVLTLDRGESRTTDVLAAADAVVTTLEGSNGAITVVWSDTLDQVAIIGSGVGTLDADLAYELWFLLDEGVAPAGLFTPHDDGTVLVVLDVADHDTKGWGITIEPHTGSDQPTSDVIFAGTV